jgi:hypothetical protein
MKSKLATLAVSVILSCSLLPPAQAANEAGRKAAVAVKAA